jgi:hypothetical protein
VSITSFHSFPSVAKFFNCSDGTAETGNALSFTGRLEVTAFAAPELSSKTIFLD